jgi:hypothetical protein
MKAGEQFACWRCGKWVDSEADWDLGHDDHDRSAYRGPEHVYCNRSNAKRTSAQLKSRRYRGKVWRRCEICGAAYRPSNWRQRTCGRVCGVELQKRNRAPAVSRKPQQPTIMRTCSECGREFKDYPRDRPQMTCSRECGWQRRRGTANAKRYGKVKPVRDRRSRWQKLLDKNRGI